MARSLWWVNRVNDHLSSLKGSIRAFVERRCACCAVREVRDGLKAHAYVSFKPRALTCTVDAWLLVRGLFS